MLELARHQNEIAQIKCLSPKLIKQKRDKINSSFIGIPIELIKFRDGRIYPYSPFMATADVPFKASFFEDAADLVINSDPESFEKADTILSEADRGGGPFAEEIGRKTGLDIALANWHKEIPKDSTNDTIIVKTDVGYSGEGYIVVRGIKKGQKVIIVDDILSTGGTAEALIKAVEGIGATVIRAFFIGEKVSQNGRYRLANSFPDLQVTTLTRFNANPGNKYTTDAALDELIGGWNPFDDLETTHEIANFENSLYNIAMENILKNFRRRILSKISHRELEKIKKEAKDEMEKTIMNIKLEYEQRKKLEQDIVVQNRVREIQGQIKF